MADSCDNALVEILVSACTLPDKTRDSRKLAEELNGLLKKRPKLASAYWNRMIAWNDLAERAVDLKEKTEHRAKAAQDAEEVLVRSIDSRQRDFARQVKERVAAES